MIWKQLFGVAIGGAIGSLARYTTALFMVQTNDFPFATLAVNLIGSFLLPFINFSKPFKSLSPTVKVAFSTGFIGSFTTFSTFSVESIHLIQIQAFSTAFIYILITLLGGLTLSGLSFWIVQRKEA